MRSFPSGWSRVLAQLGFRRTKQRRAARGSNFGRRPRLEALETRQMLTGNTYVVTTLEDIVVAGTTNDSAFSIREALTAAESNAGPDTITFAESLSQGVIFLNESLGQISVASNVEVSGPGQLALTINAQGNSRVFYVSPGVTATLSGLTITGGGNVSDGGGILNYGNLTLNEIAIVDNEALSGANAGGGGIASYNAYGVYAHAQLHLINSTVDGNHSTYGGGLKVQVENGGVLEISGSTISNNIALDSQNSGAGGGLWLSVQTGGNASIANSTLSSNTANTSAGMRITAGSLTVLNSTITENHAVAGYYPAQVGGIAVLGPATLVLQNSIVADNTAEHSCPDILSWGTIGSATAHNLIGDVGNSGITNTNGNQIINVAGAQASCRWATTAGRRGRMRWNTTARPSTWATIRWPPLQSINAAITGKCRGPRRRTPWTSAPTSWGWSSRRTSMTTTRHTTTATSVYARRCT
jgi:hypothetical protein